MCACHLYKYSYSFLLNHSVFLSYRYYQNSICGLKNDRIRIPLPPASKSSCAIVLPIVCVFLRIPFGIYVT